MKMRFFVVGLLSGAFFVSAYAEAQERTEDVQKIIRTASTVLLDRSASEDQIRGALIQLLDAAVLAMPQSEQTADARLDMKAARAEFKDPFPLSAEGQEHVARAYRLLNEGKGFQLPAVHSMEEVRSHTQGLVADSIAALKKGQGTVTARLLLECMMMVIMPIPR